MAKQTSGQILGRGLRLLGKKAGMKKPLTLQRLIKMGGGTPRTAARSTPTAAPTAAPTATRRRPTHRAVVQARGHALQGYLKGL